jgi:GcrA cell cycle regulator
MIPQISPQAIAEAIPQTLPAPQPLPPQARPAIPSNSPWTPERIERLRGCVAAGMTCSEIGVAIGVSRNAVIGKIHRLGLSSGRPAGAPRASNCPPRARHPRGPTQRRLLRLAFARAPLDEIMSGTVVISTYPRSLIDIDAHQCRWPIGDPATPQFAFCGNDAIGGFTYCLGHARMAYRGPKSRR